MFRLERRTDPGPRLGLSRPRDPSLAVRVRGVGQTGRPARVVFDSRGSSLRVRDSSLRGSYVRLYRLDPSVSPQIGPTLSPPSDGPGSRHSSYSTSEPSMFVSTRYPVRPWSTPRSDVHCLLSVSTGPDGDFRGHPRGVGLNPHRPVRSVTRHGGSRGRLRPEERVHTPYTSNPSEENGRGCPRRSRRGEGLLGNRTLTSSCFRSKLRESPAPVSNRRGRRVTTKEGFKVESRTKIFWVRRRDLPRRSWVPQVELLRRSTPEKFTSSVTTRRQAAVTGRSQLTYVEKG